MYSKGYRRRTRNMFSKKFGTRGNPNPSKLLQEYKIGDYVDCVVDPSVQKGMPHKYYHGKTGKIYNTNKTSVGIVFHRRVGGEYILRTVNARIEHLRKSRCTEEIKRVRAENARRKEEGLPVYKRVVEGPRKAFTVTVEDKPIIEVTVPKFVPARK